MNELFLRYLNEGATIVTAWCEHCKGPGWVNDIVWVILRTQQGELVQESVFDTAHLNSSIRTIFNISHHTTVSLVNEIERALRTERNK
jgi:hypothetical protein